MLRHDQELTLRESAPTGDDYNAIFPAGVGLIWHHCDDAAELASHVVEITANQGAIISVEPEGAGFQVIFAIHRMCYRAMLGRAPDPEEWLVL